MSGAWKVGKGAGLAFHLLPGGSPPLSLACGAVPIPNPTPPFLVLRLQKRLLMKTELALGRKTKCRWDMDCPRSTFYYLIRYLNLLGKKLETMYKT